MTGLRPAATRTVRRCMCNPLHATFYHFQARNITVSKRNVRATVAKSLGLCIFLHLLVQLTLFWLCLALSARDDTLRFIHEFQDCRSVGLNLSINGLVVIGVGFPSLDQSVQLVKPGESNNVEAPASLLNCSRTMPTPFTVVLGG